jgi:ribosomal protein S18 acetylase RimI-like enzyme
MFRFADTKSFGETWGKSSLKIRRFILGKDEDDWVKVRNTVYSGNPSFGQETVDEFRIFEKSPEFDSEGRFIVELDGNPVGLVYAHVDKFRKEKKGFVEMLGVIPEFRGKGIEEKLAETAMKELKKRGMQVIQSWVWKNMEFNNREEAVPNWKNLGFKLVRVGSTMTKELSEIKSNVGENTEVVLEPLRKSADEDLEMLNQLSNESFKEHFNYRPTPLESTVFFVRDDSSWQTQGWFFALLEGEHVGYVGAGISEMDNRAKNTKHGWILSIGVLKPYRNTGIGTRLILHGLNFLKANGMTTAMLGVDDSNVTKAKHLYEKVGFKATWKQLIYEKNIA